MVLVKMLMEIDPLPLRGLMVITMVTISPSRIDVFPAKQLRGALDWFRQVPPRGDGVSSRKLSYDFFEGKRLHIVEDGHRRASRGPTRQGGAPPPSWPGCGPPLELLALSILYIFWK